ncbi:MAG: hypothetical protein JXB85_01070 [Anaerolineales bacterium]|nr:hypothetical protein [Anaerolineales bacterium]
MKESFADTLAIEAAKLLMPIEQLNTIEKVTAFLGELGWSFTAPEGDFDLGDLLGIGDLIAIFAELESAGSDEETQEIVIRLIGKISEIISEVSAKAPQIIDIIENSDFIGNTADILDDLPIRVLDYLLYRYLYVHHHKIFAGLHLLGIMETVDVQEVPIKTVQWERIPTLLSDPMEVANKVYFWNNDDNPPKEFDGNKFLERFEILLRAFSLPGGIYRQADDIQAKFGRTLDDDDEEIRIPLFQTGVWPDNWVELDVNLSPIPAITDETSEITKKSGLAIYPFLTANLNIEEEIADEWVLKISGNADLEAGLGIMIRAPHNLEVMKDLFEDITDSGDMRLEVELSKTSPADSLNYIFETSTGSYLAIKEAGIKVWVVFENGDEEFGGEASIDGLTLKIDVSKGDGFIQEILSGLNLESVTDLTIGISNKEGFYFQGSSALSLVIPIHKTIGPIKIDTILIEASFGEEIIIRLAAALGFELGPLIGAIDRIGLEIPFSISENTSGNWGPVQFNGVNFLPPTGVGFAIDTEGLTGGGFLSFDYDNHRYSGFLAFAFGKISITAVGLIETKMPDGSDGFSMLINICVEFNPPIDLSYGFTLSGVGGLIGVNRTMNVEALQRGIKNHTLDAILFPDPAWVFRHAAEIIDVMSTAFPACEGRFIIGPMLKIGWGYPNIITGELGVFLELPFDPVRIALMGQMNAAFPDGDFGLMVINLDMLGVIDTAKQELSLQASLYESGLISFPNSFTISGDAAMLLNWGNSPDFALAVGGFHPRFDPPPPDYIFNDLMRMQVVITYYMIVKIDCRGYIALTPNTLQFGACVEIYIKELGLEVGGGVSFDALICYSPFSFEFSISGYMWVKFEGVSLMDIHITADLEGPTPWRVTGEAKFKILLFDVNVPFDVSWGSARKAFVASIDPHLKLIEALTNPGNWSSNLPEGRTVVEQLRPIGEAEDTPDIVIVHPSGRLEVRQNVVPFNVTLSRFGNAPVSGHDRFRLTRLEAGKSIQPDGTVAPESIDFEYVQGYHARSQSEALSKAQKLSLPSFELMDDGITTAASTSILPSGTVTSKTLNYESVLVNPDRTSKRMDMLAGMAWRRAQAQISGTLVEKFGGASASFGNGQAKVILEEQRYCVVDAVTLLPVELLDSESAGNLFDSRMAADQALERETFLQAGNEAEYLVMAECEVPA